MIVTNETCKEKFQNNNITNCKHQYIILTLDQLSTNVMVKILPRLSEIWLPLKLLHKVQHFSVLHSSTWQKVILTQQVFDPCHHCQSHHLFLKGQQALNE